MPRGSRLAVPSRAARWPAPRSPYHRWRQTGRRAPLIPPCITRHTNEHGAGRDRAEASMGRSVLVTGMMHGCIAAHGPDAGPLVP